MISPDTIGLRPPPNTALVSEPAEAKRAADTTVSAKPSVDTGGTHQLQPAYHPGLPALSTGINPNLSETYDLDRDGRVTIGEVAQVRMARTLDALGLLSGPELLHSGEGSDWIPQGQGYNAERHEILTSYNDGYRVLLSVQDQLTGVEARNVILGGKQPAPDLDIFERLAFYAINPAPSKGGGVTTDGKFVYLADTEAVYVYRRADIDAAAGETVQPVRVNHIPGNGASYVTVKDGIAYVGRFAVEPDGKGSDKGYSTNPLLRRYRIGDDGSFDLIDTIPTPYYAQGVAVTDNGLLFTTSYGNDDDSPHALVFQAFENGGSDTSSHGGKGTRPVEAPALAENVFDLDYYAEGVNVIDGQVWVTYESGADKYEGDDGRDHIQRIDLDRLKAY